MGSNQRRTVIINQARMGSTRLPGKVLKQVRGRTLLGHQIDRLRRVRLADLIVVATTNAPQDEEIALYCEKEEIPYFRGAEEDVLSRFLGAAYEFDAETIVRVTSDCPLIDPEVIDRVISTYNDSFPRYDYVSNTLLRTYPRGMDNEVFSRAALELAFQHAKGTDREHVTPYIYRTPEKFQFFNVSCPSSLGHHRWTVDTSEDFELVRRLLEAGLDRSPTFSLDDLLAIIAANPSWSSLNAHIEQKPH